MTEYQNPTLEGNSCNHDVSGLKANPEKLKGCSKLPQLLVAAGEGKDHRQEDVLPTSYSRGILSSEWKCRKMEI